MNLRWKMCSPVSTGCESNLNRFHGQYYKSRSRKKKRDRDGSDRCPSRARQAIQERSPRSQPSSGRGYRRSRTRSRESWTKITRSTTWVDGSSTRIWLPLIVDVQIVALTNKGLFDSKELHRNFEEFKSLGNFLVVVVWFVGLNLIGIFLKESFTIGFIGNLTSTQGSFLQWN